MSNFTDTYIKNLKIKEKRYEEYEGGGFGIRVSPNQLKTWIYRYKINGKTDKISIGHYPSMSLSSARKKYIELFELKQTGIVPKQSIQREEEKKNDTISKLMEAWYKSYVVKNRKKPLQIRQQIDADITPLLGHLEIEKIKQIVEAKPNISFLNNSCEFYNNYLFVGTVLWSKIVDKDLAEIYKINDLDLIQNMTIDKYNEIHNESVKFLTETLVDNKNINVIILTHHVPLLELINEKYEKEYEQWFGTDLKNLLDIILKQL